MFFVRREFLDGEQARIFPTCWMWQPFPSAHYPVFSLVRSKTLAKATTSLLPPICHRLNIELGPRCLNLSFSCRGGEIRRDLDRQFHPWAVAFSPLR